MPQLVDDATTGDATTGYSGGAHGERSAVSRFVCFDPSKDANPLRQE